MRPTFWISWTGAVALLCAGCMSGPLLDNPTRVAAGENCPNPVYLPQGPGGYGLVFECVLDTIADYFPIAYANRYDGRIETFPVIAPGLEQPWKPGSPDFAQRLLASLQTIRHRAMVLIQPAEDGGYFVDVRVFKELEDQPKPTRAATGAAAFRSDNTVERQFEVVEATPVETGWIPIGEDVPLEQKLLSRIAHCKVGALQPDGPCNVPPPARR